MLATEYARYYGVEEQRENESDMAFRGRVSTALRDMGHIIEAHEAYQDERYEDSDSVMTGLFGAMAQALQGTRYGGDPVGNDIAAGTLVRHRMSPEYQRELEAKQMMAGLLLAGLSPDDLKEILG
jgi:hypothetical protein